jgi:hypothetical protein
MSYGILLRKYKNVSFCFQTRDEIVIYVSTCGWDDDEVRFVLDQHAELDFRSASSPKQQSAGRNVTSFGHIISYLRVDPWALRLYHRWYQRYLPTLYLNSPKFSHELWHFTPQVQKRQFLFSNQGWNRYLRVYPWALRLYHILWREQVNYQWDDDEVRFVLDQHAELDFRSASSENSRSFY